MKRLMALLLLALFSMGTLSACNTVAGAGKDVQKAGEKCRGQGRGLQGRQVLIALTGMHVRRGRSNPASFFAAKIFAMRLSTAVVRDAMHASRCKCCIARSPTSSAD